MKKETLERAGAVAAGLCQHLDANEQAMFIAGFQECIKWQQERMYSEQEVRELVDDYEGDKFRSATPLSFRWWFNKFKKK
jgi:hypothetical protein